MLDVKFFVGIRSGSTPAARWSTADLACAHDVAILVRPF